MPNLELPGGRKLAYREDGSGSPLVLVHGSPGEGRSWARVVPHLKDRFRTICPDLPGYGGSDRLEADEPAGRMDAMGAAVARLVERLADSLGAPVRLVGHSYGGNIALQAALQVQAGAVERIVLLEPVYFRALQLTGDEAALKPAAAHFEDYARRATAGEPEVVRLMIDYWFGDGAFGRMPDPVRGYLSASAARNAIDVRSSFLGTSTAAELAALQCPVMIVDGETSQEIVRSIARALVTLLPNARMEGLAGANHGMLDTHPEAVARLIAT
ncbi:MAG: alpha/beta hydrolase [Reyranella sp.]|nr:alpha/beta hydrolase [Reyranella sp.]MDP3163032.1 alpha/beta hydrolase [Reyranella sp.]